MDSTMFMFGIHKGQKRVSDSPQIWMAVNHTMWVLEIGPRSSARHSWPRAHSTNQSGLKHTEIHSASASQVLKLKACVTEPSLRQIDWDESKCKTMLCFGFTL